MNNKRAYYYPIPAYLIMLLMVWVWAFFADVVQLLFGGASPTSSLTSAEGVRWALRTALPSINALPWGETMMLVAIYGLLRGSGLAKAMLRIGGLHRPTATELRALLFSFVVAICYIALLYMSAVAPWRILAGVTDEVALSPLAQGWGLLLFVGVLLVSLIYGFIYGNYSSMMDVVVSTGRTFVLFVPAMMALVPASGIVPCMQYIGLESIFSVSLEVVTAILYMLPFVYIMLLEMNEQ